MFRKLSTILILTLIIISFSSVAFAQRRNEAKKDYILERGQYRDWVWSTVWDDTLMRAVADTTNIIDLSAGNQFMISSFVKVLGADSAAGWTLRFFSMNDNDSLMSKRGTGAADSIWAAYASIDSARVIYEDVSAQLRVHDRVRFTMQRIGTTLTADTLLVRLRIGIKR